MEMISMVAKVFHFPRHQRVWRRTLRGGGREEFFEALDEPMVRVVAELVQQRFHPLGRCLVFWIEMMRQLPEMPTGVVETRTYVKNLLRSLVLEY